ncbi:MULTISPECIES: NAD(P)/FAD-dependent oxidoreductase [unclassified Gemella]|uniref:NAD(P)/FAD-dependent oxidoreductase n=1 Tax=unclassified Gemella TaxID=2624949 RepID=UPI001C03C9BF|nr:MULTISPECIES: NAD(P)/FAD-dependent oxidoreductase [unclassified Gemella]MBU0278845.1 NAD(P)/FAD-dependent oxidoreductase [Gemella sp. zg-1178]QWQ39392.1 NAD(P)/FAD-dependent oxidoreductase [Gemella sp. zg-570]
MKNIVILGAGYGGLTTLKGLKKVIKSGEAKVTLVNKNSYHYDSVNLHEVSAGNISSSEICIEIKDILETGVNFLQDEVVKIDTDKKLVHTKTKELAYDILVVGLGFESNTFGIEGMLDNSMPITDIKAAEKISKKIEENFKKYAESTEKDEKDISIIVGGTGLAGIEFLAELVDRRKVLCKKYGIDEKLVKIYGLDAAPVLLPMFDKEYSDYARKYLEDRGVEIILGAGIKGSTPDSFIIEVEGERKELKASTLVWTAGVKGSRIMDETFPELAKNGRLVTTQELTVPGLEEVYIVGDCAAFIEEGQSRPYPPTAQIANQMGEYVSNHILNRLRGTSSTNFKYINRGVVCSLGSKDAIASVFGKFKYKGFLASKTKKLIEAKSINQCTNLKTAIRSQRIL